MEDTETRTLDQFINQDHGITAVAYPAESNPNMQDAAPDARHYLVTLQCGARMIDVPFTMGAALTEEPTAADVLDCLASDASSIEQEPDWLAWARDMGYESIEDAENARRTYTTIQEQAAALKELLGENAYNDLLWNTERL